MSLLLKPVPPAQGARWMRDAFRLFGRSPLPFSLLFVAFLVTALFSSIVPLVGPLLMLASLPMMSLGFMVATESALSGGPVHPGQYLLPLRKDPERRKSLLVLCGLYGLASVAIMLVSDWVDGGAFDQLQVLLADGSKGAEAAALDDHAAQPTGQRAEQKEGEKTAERHAGGGGRDYFAGAGAFGNWRRTMTSLRRWRRISSSSAVVFL